MPRSYKDHNLETPLARTEALGSAISEIVRPDRPVFDPFAAIYLRDHVNRAKSSIYMFWRLWFKEFPAQNYYAVDLVHELSPPPHIPPHLRVAFHAVTDEPFGVIKVVEKKLFYLFGPSREELSTYKKPSGTQDHTP